MKTLTLGVMAGCCLLFHTTAYGVLPPMAVTGKEYSNAPDTDATGLIDSEQSIFWTGTGAAFDTFDFTPGPGPLRVPPLPTFIENPQTDALANSSDFLFNDVRANRSSLIFSTDGDPSIYFEAPGGGSGIWAAPPMINAASPPRDVDAIEVWGPDSAATGSGDDSFNYSLESVPPLGPGAFDPGLVPVWHVPGSIPGGLGPVAVPLITTFELAMAIAPLAAIPVPPQVLQEELDLDALMLNDVIYEEVPGTPGIRRARLNFSIDPIIDPASGAAVFDGGEIFVWDFDSTLPIMPASFLFHGGHLWDTAFPVMATFGTASENVNGIESVPEPATGASLLTLVCLWIGLRRPTRSPFHPRQRGFRQGPARLCASVRCLFAHGGAECGQCRSPLDFCLTGMLDRLRCFDAPCSGGDLFLWPAASGGSQSGPARILALPTSATSRIIGV